MNVDEPIEETLLKLSRHGKTYPQLMSSFTKMCSDSPVNVTWYKQEDIAESLKVNCRLSKSVHRSIEEKYIYASVVLEYCLKHPDIFVQVSSGDRGIHFRGQIFCGIDRRVKGVDVKGVSLDALLFLSSEELSKVCTRQVSSSELRERYIPENANSLINKYSISWFDLYPSFDKLGLTFKKFDKNGSLTAEVSGGQVSVDFESRPSSWSVEYYKSDGSLRSQGGDYYCERTFYIERNWKGLPFDQSKFFKETPSEIVNQVLPIRDLFEKLCSLNKIISI